VDALIEWTGQSCMIVRQQPFSEESGQRQRSPVFEQRKRFINFSSIAARVRHIFVL
jgi:hypothetical protein